MKTKSINKNKLNQVKQISKIIKQDKIVQISKQKFVLSMNMCVCLEDERDSWLSVSGAMVRENVMLVKTGLTCEVPPCV
jgi:hypothetical protein